MSTHRHVPPVYTQTEFNQLLDDFDDHIDGAILDGQITAAKLAMKIQYPYTFLLHLNDIDCEAIDKNGNVVYGGSTGAGEISGIDTGAIMSAVLGTGNVLITGVSQEETVLNVGTLTAAWLTIASGTKNVLIQNLTIDGNEQTETLIMLTNDSDTNNIVFRNVTFKNFNGKVFDSTDATTDLNTKIVIDHCTFKEFNSSETTNLIDLRIEQSCFTNNTFTSDGTHGGYAIYLRYSNDTVIENNLIDGLAAGIAVWRWKATQNCYRNKIVNNTIKNTFATTDGYWPIFVQGGENIVSSNTIYNPTRSAIAVQGGDTEDNNVCSNNIVKFLSTEATNVTGSQVGIWLHGEPVAGTYSDNNIVTGNIIEGAYHGIIALYNQTPTISNNKITGCQSNGIYVWDTAPAALVTGNYVIGNGLCGASTDAYSYVVAGIYLKGSDYAQVVNNTVKNNYNLDLGIHNGCDSVYVSSFNSKDSTSATGISDLGTNTTIVNSWNKTVFIPLTGGSVTSYKSMVIPFAGSSNGSAGIADNGFNIDAAGELAHTFFVMPNDLSRIIEIRVWAYTNVTEADAMLSNWFIRGALENGNYVDVNLGWSGTASRTTNFTAQDIIYWKNGSSVAAFTAGMCCYVKFQGCNASGANCATNCNVRCVEVVYV